jgi:hypothetical protein
MHRSIITGIRRQESGEIAGNQGWPASGEVSGEVSGAALREQTVMAVIRILMQSRS